MSITGLYPQLTVGRMRAHIYSFWAAAFEDEVPEELWVVLDPWIDQFAKDDITKDDSSKGTRAWAVRHEAAVQQQSLLVDRRCGMVSELMAF